MKPKGKGVRLPPAPEPPSDDEHRSDAAKRKLYLRKLEKVLDRLFERAEADLGEIKPREVLYNTDIALSTYLKLQDRDVPTPQSQTTTLTVQGMTREDALAMLRGHAAPSKAKDTIQEADPS